MKSRIFTIIIISFLLVTGILAQDYPDSVVARIPVGNSPSGIAALPNGNFVYVANAQSSNVSVISTVTNSIFATIPVGGHPYGVAALPNSNYVYVTNSPDDGLGYVSVINTATNTVVTTIYVGYNLKAIVALQNGNYVYATSSVCDTVFAISTATNAVVTYIPVGGNPYGLATHPNNNYVYVTNSVGYVSVISTTTNTVIDSIPVGYNLRQVAVLSNGNYIYVVKDYGYPTVSVISTSTNTVVATINLDYFWHYCGVVALPNSNYVYAITTFGLIQVISTATNSCVTEFGSVGNSHWGVPTGAAAPNGDYVYVTNDSSENVVVFGLRSSDFQSNYLYAWVTRNYPMIPSSDTTDIEFSLPPDTIPKEITLTINLTKDTSLSFFCLVGGITITNSDTLNAINISTLNDTLWLPACNNECIYKNSLLSDSPPTILPGSNITIPIYAENISAPYFDTIGVNFISCMGNWYQRERYDAIHFQNVKWRWIGSTYVIPDGFNLSFDHKDWFIDSIISETTLTTHLLLTNQSAPSGTHRLMCMIVSVCNPGFVLDSIMDTLFIDLHVASPPDTEWGGTTYSNTYWKKHPEIFAQFLPVYLRDTVVNTTSIAISILKDSRPNAAWNCFKCHFLTTIFNSCYESSLLSAYYDDPKRTGEFMEGYPVSQILSHADAKFPDGSPDSLLAFKNVFDDINHNKTTHVLWCNGGGGSGTTLPLPAINSVALYPNPFFDKTEIKFSSVVKTPTSIKIYDLSGKKVCDLTINNTSRLIWDGSDNRGIKLSRGVYFLSVNGAVNTTLRALIIR